MKRKNSFAITAVESDQNLYRLNPRKNKLAKVNGFTIRESIVKINHPNHSLRIWLFYICICATNLINPKSKMISGA